MAKYNEILICVEFSSDVTSKNLVLNIVAFTVYALYFYLLGSNTNETSFYIQN